MREGATKIRLKDYRQPAFWVEQVGLHFKLHPTATRVSSKITFRPNESAAEPQDLQLDGRNLTLISAAIDGRELTKEELFLDSEGLRVPHGALPKGSFKWTCEVEINPKDNTALEGLYMSNEMYCTQCEAQGFRKITYYPDRPDVMAEFRVKIDGAASVLLSNGNPTGPGEWHDPWVKPSYLFALVAGNLVSLDDVFITMSGRVVDLKIYVRPGDEGKCAYAMDGLKRSMAWDEREYGREYDLDLFMIVAVDDFNMGAMENKGLNIFNSKYVLASPETATDGDFARIEAIIAHEYFHNWTGNRITCRDWFQLCLKEGLTVFRDQSFSGDERSHAVTRISDVLTLRARQFREDAGPLAHPVRPEEYIEINNFYTATVYEKGAEIIRMLHTLIGAEAYRAALDLYFERHDGQACTIEDWIRVFEDSTGRDLSQFMRWYSQAGTPRLSVNTSFKDGSYVVSFEQETPVTPGQPNKEPLVIPVDICLLDREGNEILGCQVLEVDQEKQIFTFDGLKEEPVLSVLRGFSAPVILNYTRPSNDQVFLLAHDTDPFNMWEAGRNLSRDVLIGMITQADTPLEEFLSAMVRMIKDDSLDPAFRALAMTLPGEDEMAQHLFETGFVPDPLEIYRARGKLKGAIAGYMAPCLQPLYDAMKVTGPYSPTSGDAAKRALRGAVLGLICQMELSGQTAKEQFDRANNMTEQQGALALLIAHGQGREAVAAFHDQWQRDRQVADKWFALQASATPPDTAVETVVALSEHPDFDWKNPNRFRSLIGAFATNQAGFHQADGAGYDLVADWLIRLDQVNPQTTARMCGVFETWRRYDAGRQAKAKAAIKRIAGRKDVSKDSAEILEKILGA